MYAKTPVSALSGTLRRAAILSALLAALLCLAFACMHPASAEAAESYDQSGARSMLSNVNSLRANEAWITRSNGSRYQLPQALSPYVWDSGLEKVAKLRAKEIAQSFSHTRPNGQSCFTAYTELGVSTPAQGENIAMGYTSVESVMAGWAEANQPYSGQGHRRNMLGGVYETGSGSVGTIGFTCIGIACCQVNGVKYWVQEFGSESSSSTWKRLAGNTALGTMKQIVNEGWTSGSKYAIIATTNGYYDALAASALAGLMNNSPVLMTAPDKLSDATKQLLQSKKVKDVVIVGGTQAVSANVESQIRALGIGVLTRCAGNTAIGTANKIYEYGKRVNGGWGDDAIVATAKSYQDALSIAPYAYQKKAPIFLAQGKDGTLTSGTVKAIQNGGFKRTIITGGTAAVAKSVESQVTKSWKRLWGNTAYGTSRKIADFCIKEGNMTAAHMGVATGRSYYDALAGAALCGKMNSVLILADDGNSNTVDNVVKVYRAQLQQSCYVFGGRSAIQPTVWNKIVSS